MIPRSETTHDCPSWVQPHTHAPPSFPSLAVWKSGRPCYLFLRDDVIRKWQTFAELTGCVSCVFNRLHAQLCVRVASCQLDMCSKLPGILALLLFWAQCAHAQLDPFYHSTYPDVTMCPLPLFRTGSDGKLGGGLGMRLLWVYIAVNMVLSISIQHVQQ